MFINNGAQMVQSIKGCCILRYNQTKNNNVMNTQNTQNQSVRELLFENNFCRIYKYHEKYGHIYQPFVREDKILGSRVTVNSYFNESGEWIQAEF